MDEPLGLGWLLLATVLKISVILGLALLLYAPVFVLFERRQSAMMQDRVGPMMGGVKLPRIVIDNIPMLQAGAFGVAALSAIGLVVSIVMVAQGAGTDAIFVEPFFGIRHTWNGLMLVFFVLMAVHVPAGIILPHLFHHDRLTLFGGLHALFDAIKAFTKEDLVPPRGDKFLFNIAPIIAMFPAFAIGAVIPFGPTLYPSEILNQLPEIGVPSGPAIPLQVASLNVGILYVFAIAGTGIIGAAIAGYSSDNKYALLGGLRAASQMVSYEVTLGLALVPMFMIYDTLLLGDMVQWQVDHVWGVLLNPIAFVIFMSASIAEYKRVPFDAPEGESEIVAGFFLEYTSGKWLMYMIGEFIEVAVSSMLIAVVFFGGWDVPFFLSRGGWGVSLPSFEGGFHWVDYQFDLSGTDWAILSEVANSHLVVTLVMVGAFVIKALLLGILSLQVRWTLPRFRYDQIMQLCWKLLLPISLVNILITGLAILAFEAMGN